MTGSSTIGAPPGTGGSRRSSDARVGVVLLGAGLVALSGPGQTAGFSVFVDPITEAYGVSRSQLTTAYLVATLLAAPTGLWLGRHLDRRRVATMIRVVGLCLAAGLLLTAVAPNVPLLTLGIFGLRAFGQTGMTLTASVLVARAIRLRRGAALGWMSAVGGLAISATPLGASRLIPLVGHRWAWAVLAGVVLGGSLLLSLVASRVAPAVPDPFPALDEPSEGAADDPALHAAAEYDRTGSTDRRERRWAFVVVTAGVASTGAVGTALAFHQIALLGERGLSATAAAANFVPQSAATAITAVIVGRLVDRLPSRVVIPAVMLSLAGALASLQFVRSSATAVLFGMLLGGAVAANHASEGALLVRWTGTATLGRLRGRMMAVSVASTALAPLWFSLLADAVGSFTRAAMFTMAIPLAAMVLAGVAPLPPDRHRIGRGGDGHRPDSADVGASPG